MKGGSRFQSRIRKVFSRESVFREVWLTQPDAQRTKKDEI